MEHVIENHPENGKLKDVSTQDLITELRNRGYTGNVVMHKEIKF